MRRLVVLAAVLSGCSSQSSGSEALNPDHSADDEEGSAYDAFDPLGKDDGVQLGVR